jgi:hypothetical protein
VNRIFTWLRVLASIVLPLLFSQVLAAQTPQTIFEFVSPPGDYIGQGQTLALTPSDVTFTEYPGYPLVLLCHKNHGIIVITWQTC